MIASSVKKIIPSLLVVPLMLVAGCGPTEQKYEQQEVVKVTAADRVRAWVEGVAATGELDSGAETIKQTVGELQAEGVANAAEIGKLIDELLAAGGVGPTKAKAQEVLNALPPKAGM